MNETIDRLELEANSHVVWTLVNCMETLKGVPEGRELLYELQAVVPNRVALFKQSVSEEVCDQ